MGLFRMGFTEFPMVILTCTNLTHLYLECNKLTSIPRDLVNLVKLKSLSLARNELTSVPRELGNLVNLEKLTLSHNKLTSVPRELENLMNINILTLNDNELTSIPHGIETFKCLLPNREYEKLLCYEDLTFPVEARDTVDRIVGKNTFSDLGRLCARFLSYHSPPPQ